MWGKSSGNEQEPSYLRSRQFMVKHQLESRGIKDRNVLHAMGRVPRHAFVPDSLVELAYSDGPLPIGHEQTISQPYVVAAMSAALELKPGSKVLEIGTGSGYQAAILAEMGLAVFTVERLQALSDRAAGLLDELGYADVEFLCGDGYLGWPEHAPYDGIIVTAAADTLPAALIEQLVIGGRLVIPLGLYSQDLLVYRKINDSNEYSEEFLFPVRFVPMVHD